MRPLIVPATYRPTGVSRWEGNPFIEALPALETSKLELHTRISNSPPKPTNALRKKGEIVRIAELSAVGDFVYPLEEYKKGALALTMGIREAYVARNPLSVQDRQRRHAIAYQGHDGVPFPHDWKSSAQGSVFLGNSGSGKTTLIDAWSLPYQVVIEHSRYKGYDLKCRQVPWIKIRVSHDATLKGLCLQFFQTIDQLLGTDYRAEARRIGSIAAMAQLMGKVATAVSLGMVGVDEVQNLKAARGGNAEFVLNLFSEITEQIGIGLVVVATPAFESVVDRSVRNLRKLNSGGEIFFKPMRRNDPQWLNLTEELWDYTYTKKKGRLTDDTRSAWYQASAGNPAFTALSFVLTQRNEIGGREVVDDVGFERTANTDMAILEPAVRALRSGNPKLLREFDDLLFKEGCRALRCLIGWSNEEEQIAEEAGEFAEVDHRQRAKERKKKDSSSRSVKKSSDIADLPMENPLNVH